MSAKQHIVCVIGPTASGKSGRAVMLSLERNGEVISVDSRQVYRGLDIGTEKITKEEMNGIPHHLIDICDAKDTYSAGDFVKDASRLIEEISMRGKLPILAGGSHFYFDALLYGLPANTPPNQGYREELELLSTEELFKRVVESDPARAESLDPHNRRRLIRALEIIDVHGSVPVRDPLASRYDVEWVIINPPREELRERINERLAQALDRGLIEEVERVREEVGDARLNELGLEYRIVGEFLRGDRSRESLLPALQAKLAQYARRQRGWLRKLTDTLRSDHQ